MGKSTKRTSLYPLMLDLTDKPCLVIGGGRVAERKTASLLEAGASITVVSPELTDQLEAWAAEGKLTARRTPYTEGLAEMAEALLVFAATDQNDVNQRVQQEAERLGKLVNSADEGSGGGFTVPAMVRRGSLTLAVSTGGASPGLASMLREQLEASFGEEYEIYLDILQVLRSKVREWGADQRTRQEMMRTILKWDLLSMIRHGQWNDLELAQLLKLMEGLSTAEALEAAWTSFGRDRSTML